MTAVCGLAGQTRQAHELFSEPVDSRHDRLTHLSPAGPL
jgi:hypothetical protein